MEQIGRDAASRESPGGGAIGWADLGPPLFAALAWAAAAALARAHGLSAVSDDDFARVTIAQRFAHAPSLDPSGTSWLPFPFWTTGLAMIAFGRSLAVAHGVAIAQAAASGVLLFLAGRRAGVGAASATLGALLPLALPLDRVLAAATVPEVPTAALVAYAIFAVRTAPLSAGCAALAASLSRYEAWPAAALVAVGLLASTSREQRSRAAIGAALALAGPAAWVGWNAFAHGDALHFAHRVAGYRAGLGVARDASAYGAALLREGGVLVALAAISVAALGRDGRARFGLAVAACVLLVATPTVAALAGGAPTHHPERAVIAVFFLASVLAAGAGPEAALAIPRVRPFSAVILAVTTIVFFGARRVPATWSSLGPARGDELALGRAVAAELPPGERFLLVPTSFGYLATIAAIGRPEDARAIVRRSVDPRSALESDPFDSRSGLEAAASREGARWVVAEGAQAASLSSIGVVAIPLPGGALGRMR